MQVLYCPFATPLPPPPSLRTAAFPPQNPCGRQPLHALSGRPTLCTHPSMRTYTTAPPQLPLHLNRNGKSSHGWKKISPCWQRATAHGLCVTVHGVVAAWWEVEAGKRCGVGRSGVIGRRGIPLNFSSISSLTCAETIHSRAKGVSCSYI